MSGQALITKQSFFYLQKETWNDPNYQDFKYVIKERESHRMVFLHQSPQREYRAALIHHMKNYATKHNLSICCLHLAIYILDLFMDNHSITSSHLLLVANVCLLLAGKLEESAATIPKVTELNAAVKDTYSIENYRVIECIVLKYFCWNVMFSTAAHCTYYFMDQIVNINDLILYKPIRTLHFKLNAFIHIYLDKIIDDIHYMQFFSPSRLAAAVIFIARTKVGLSGWTLELQNLTGFTTEEILKPVEALTMNNFDSCFNCKNKFDKQTTN